MTNCPYCGAELDESGGLYRCKNGSCPLHSVTYYDIADLQDRANNIKNQKAWGKTFTGKFPSQQWLGERTNARMRRFIERALRTKKCPACKKKDVLIIRSDTGLAIVTVGKGSKSIDIAVPEEFVCENCGAHGSLKGLIPGKVWDKLIDVAKRYGVEVLGEVVRGWKGKEKGPKRIGGEVPIEGKKYWTERYFKWVGRGIGRTGRFGYDKSREKWRGYRERRKAGKEAEKETRGGEVRRGVGKVVKAPFRAAKETVGFPARMVGKRILKMRAPRPKRESRLQTALFPLILLIIGAAVSAAAGNLFFMFAFLCWVGYSILPQPYDPIQKIIEKIENRYNKRLDDLQDKLNSEKDPTAQERIKWEIERLERRMNRQIEFSVGSPWGVFKQTMTSGKIAVKEVFRWGAFALFSLAFLTSTFPLAQPIGLILAFIFYFMMGGRR